MGNFLNYFKNEANGLFQNKKNLINLLVLGILILAVPLVVTLIRNQQIFKSRAGVDAIVFSGNNVEQRNGKWIVLDPKQAISLQLTSPLGPPGTGTQQPGNCSSAALSLSPATGSIFLGQDNEIDVKLAPNGCDITAVEFGLNYVSTTLNVTSASPGSDAFGVIEAGDSSEGGKHYIFTRAPGSTLSQEVVIGKILFKPTASATAAKGIFVNIVGIAGSDGSPYITVSGQGNLPANKKTVTSGTYDIVSK